MPLRKLRSDDVGACIDGAFNTWVSHFKTVAKQVEKSLGNGQLGKKKKFVCCIDGVAQRTADQLFAPLHFDSTDSIHIRSSMLFSGEHALSNVIDGDLSTMTVFLTTSAASDSHFVHLEIPSTHWPLARIKVHSGRHIPDRDAVGEGTDSLDGAAWSLFVDGKRLSPDGVVLARAKSVRLEITHAPGTLALREIQLFQMAPPSKVEHGGALFCEQSGTTCNGHVAFDADRTTSVRLYTTDNEYITGYWAKSDRFR